VGVQLASLLMPHLALGKIDKIKVSTHLWTKDIFNLCPFIVKKTKMVLKPKSTTSI
jgi:hypothetical protein